MILTDKDSTQQLFLDRRKNISRILQIAVIRNNIEIEIPTERILTKTFKYTELGSQTTEKLFGLCSNPYVFFSLKDYRLKAGEKVKVGFRLENSADVDSNEVVNLGVFEINNINKDYKNKIYDYTAYNFIVKDTPPTNFDLWRADYFRCYHTKRAEAYKEHTYYKMSFGILNHKCGIDNYFSGFGSYSGYEGTTNMNCVSENNSQRIELHYKYYCNIDTFDGVRYYRRFNDYNKIYKVYKNRLVKSSQYNQAYSLMAGMSWNETRYLTCARTIPNIIKNGEIYPFVLTEDLVNDYLSEVFPLFGNSNEEELFLYNDLLESSGLTYSYLCYPTKIKVTSYPTGELIEEYSIYESDNNFIEEGSGVGLGSTMVINMEHKTNAATNPYKENVTREFKCLGSASISNVNYTVFLNDAYELLGKRTKPAINDPNRKIVECATSSPNIYGLYPENTLFPKDDTLYPLTLRLYPRRATPKGSEIHTYEFPINKKYGSNQLETLIVEDEVYKYSGIRYLKDGLQVTEAWEGEVGEKALNNIYDLTQNDLINNQEIKPSVSLLHALKNETYCNIEAKTIGDPTIEIGDYITVNQNVSAPITSKVLKGDQFMFDEISAEHGTPNKNDDEWRKIDIRAWVM